MEKIKESRVSGHVLKMEDRKSFETIGVLNVVTFNDSTVELNTVMGVLIVKGKNLEVSMFNMDTGTLRVTGEFDSLLYTNKGTKKESLVKKLLK